MQTSDVSQLTVSAIDAQGNASGDSYPLAAVTGNIAIGGSGSVEFRPLVGGVFASPTSVMDKYDFAPAPSTESVAGTNIPPAVFSNGTDIKITITYGDTTHTLFVGTVVASRAAMQSTMSSYSAVRAYTAVPRILAVDTLPTGALLYPSLHEQGQYQLTAPRIELAARSRSSKPSKSQGINIAEYIAEVLDNKPVAGGMTQNSRATPTIAISDVVDIASAPVLRLDVSSHTILRRYLSEVIAGTIRSETNYRLFLAILKQFYLIVVPRTNTTQGSQIIVDNPWKQQETVTLGKADILSIDMSYAERADQDVTGVVADWLSAASLAQMTGARNMQTGNRVTQLGCGVYEDGQGSPRLWSGKLELLQSKEGTFRLTKTGAAASSPRFRRVQLPDWLPRIGLSIGQTDTGKKDTSDVATTTDRALKQAIMCLEYIHGSIYRAGSSAVVTVPLSAGISVHLNNIGEIYKVVLEDDILYGRLQGVRYSITVSPRLELTCVLQLTHLRTDKDNSNLAISNEMYDAPKTATQATAGGGNSPEDFVWDS